MNECVSHMCISVCVCVFMFIYMYVCLDFFKGLLGASRSAIAKPCLGEKSNFCRTQTVSAGRRVASPRLNVVGLR